MTEMLTPNVGKHRYTQERLEGTPKDKLWVGIFAITNGWLAWQLAGRASDSIWILVTAFLFGWVLSDFVSGFVHWAGDTWGTVDWPVIGPAMIRPFREHHFDPKSITRHDFFDVNGTNCLISLPLIIGALFVDVQHAGGFTLFIVGTICSLTLWTFATNQIHKWAHCDEVHWTVRALQRAWIILPTSEHDIHHAAPFAKYYCITSGWLNYGLNRVGFYRRSERLITWLTGARARDEEAKAAVEILGRDLSQQS